MSIWIQYKEANGGAVAAAIALGRGLMTDDPANFKRGYSADNAYLAVMDVAGAEGDEFTDAEQNAIKLGLADDRSPQEIAAKWAEGNVEDPDPADEIEA